MAERKWRKRQPDPDWLMVQVNESADAGALDFNGEVGAYRTNGGACSRMQRLRKKDPKTTVP
jgi:hypothetical protein